MRYWEDKRERQLSLGPYPPLGLKEARIKRDEIHLARLQGISPARKHSPKIDRHTFGAVAMDWLNVRMGDKAPSYLRTIKLRLDKYVLPMMKNEPLTDITTQDVLRLCRRIESEGRLETAKRVKDVIGQVFRFAIASGLADADPTVSLAGALKTAQERHFATIINPDEIRLLIKAIQGYPYPVMRAALLFSILTFARPGEIRAAEWAEIKEDVWDIPAEKMKMRRRHLVPLSSQAQEVLTELRGYTGGGRWLFPSPRNNGACMSENGVRTALRAMGYTREQITPHGFRAMASTILHEQGFNPLIIERQLAHVQGNTVARAYNHAEYLEERRALMKFWGDWLFKES